MSTLEGPVDYGVNEDGVFYEDIEQLEDGDGQESDPLASSSDEQEKADQRAHEEVFGPSIDDLIAESRGRRGRRRKSSGGYGGPRKRARPSDVPSHLKYVMSAATLAYMNQKWDEATDALNTIIMEAPKAVAPYRTLGLIFEQKGDMEKSLEMFMKAAENDKQDRELWKRNAALWEELGNPEKAIHCLTQALRGMRGKDEDALRGRGHLYFLTRKFRKAADSYVKLSKLTPMDIDVARRIHESYHAVGEGSRAVPFVEVMLRSCEVSSREGKMEATERLGAVIVELIELLVQIRFAEKNYNEAHRLLIRLSGRNRELGKPMTFVQRLMVAICQHRLGSSTLAEPTFREFLSSPSMVAKHTLLLLQVAEACRDAQKFKSGARAYTLLLQRENVENRAELHLQRAICHLENDELLKAKDDLEKVLAIQPRNVEASLRMQQFLPPKPAQSGNAKRKQKRFSSDDIFSILPNPSINERKEARGALQLASALFAKGDYDGYLQHIYLALEAALFLGESAYVSECEAVEENGDENDDMGSDDDEERKAADGYVTTSVVKNRDFWKPQSAPKKDKQRLHALGANLMRLLLDEEFAEVAERVVLSFQAVGHISQAHRLIRTFDSLAHLRVKRERELRKKVKLLSMITHIAIGDVPCAEGYARIMLLDSPSCPDLAYAYATVAQLWTVETDSQRSNSFRFLKRLREKTPSSVHLALIAGNCSSRGGLNIRRYTVGIYLQALALAPHQPLICLSLAIQVLYVAMGRRVQNRNEMMVHALGFLDDYRRNRISATNEINLTFREMETSYNVGRAMHQLGLLNYAADMYQQVLHWRWTGGRQRQAPVWADLRRDAAFNLMQIERGSGNSEGAAAVCAKYLQF